MDALAKLDVLKVAYPDPVELGQVVDKLVDGVLSQYRLKLKRYERDLLEFEERYRIDSPAFYRRFEDGQMGDGMDYFEWAGVYELRQETLELVSSLDDRRTGGAHRSGDHR